jgi:tryptophan synthase alpha chain
VGRLQDSLAAAKSGGRKILVPFLTGEYPDRDTFVSLLHAVESSGADAVEVGIPFSDPSADGPVIQGTSQKALERGASVRRIFESVRRARDEGLKIPLLYMTYYNPILRFGPSEFAAKAAESGADGVLVVDLPPEEAGEFAPAARAASLDTVFLVAPTTPEERIPKVLDECRGFVYCVSVTGVTGGKLAAAESVRETVSRIRKRTDLPVLVGFGVIGPDSARELAGVSDGVIVGSALLSAIADRTGVEAVAAAKAFLGAIRAAL